MIRNFLSILVLALGTGGICAGAAGAAEDGPDTGAAREFIATLADETLSILEASETPAAERREQFSSLLEKGVNTDYISRFVLGRFWRQASDEQKRRFESLFKQFLLANLTDRLSGEYENQSFKVTNAVAAGRRDVLVRSEIQRVNGPALPVEWRVRDFDGQWQIIDIKAEGISLAITQREEYGAVIQRRGIDGLLSALGDQVDAMREGRPSPALAEQS